jgi:GNAT superfamily N-acetyltransferase
VAAASKPATLAFMKVRAAGMSDLPALVRLNAEAHAFHMAAVPGAYRVIDPVEVEGWFRGLLAEERYAILVAEEGGEAIGFAVVERVDEPGHIFALPRRIANVAQLGVTAAARRRGAGRALMAAAEELARAWGASAVTLSVVAFNADADRFYRALGYAPSVTRMTKPL